jgi:CheY-like chemotaxis protein
MPEMTPPSDPLPPPGIKKFDEPEKDRLTAPENMENMETMVEILVAEDEPAVALAIKSALKYCGYAVHTVPNGEIALESIQAEPGRFSVVLTDHSMPGVGGIALVKALRAIGYPGKIVILSAYLTSQNEAQYEELGVDQILSKPFNLNRLRIALESALDSAGCA